MHISSPHLEVGAVQLGRFQGVCPHVSGPVSWVDYFVIDNAQKAVKPERLFLVLYKAPPGPPCLCNAL